MTVVHPSVLHLFDAYRNDPPHALLITGPAGIGASTIAMKLAGMISKNPIRILPEKDEQVDLEKGTITVGIIRRLYEQTRSRQAHKQVYVIDYAERMASQAQNAFLKLLEEPNQTTLFILVTHEPQKLLPTIHSRVQKLDLPLITREQSEELLKNLDISDATKRAQLLYMAEGLPAELTRLVQDDEYFAKGAQLVRDARELLQGNSYSKLIIAHKYKDDRAMTLKLIDIAIRMLKSHTINDPKPALLSQLDRLVTTYETIAANGNIRLHLASFVL